MLVLLWVVGVCVFRYVRLLECLWRLCGEGLRVVDEAKSPSLGWHSVEGVGAVFGSEEVVEGSQARVGRGVSSSDVSQGPWGRS